MTFGEGHHTQEGGEVVETTKRHFKIKRKKGAQQRTSLLFNGSSIVTHTFSLNNDHEKEWTHM